MTTEFILLVFGSQWNQQRRENDTKSAICSEGALESVCNLLLFALYNYIDEAGTFYLILEMI